MPRSSRSPRQLRLQQILAEARQTSGLTQAEVARQLRRPQSFVSKYESGERRLDVVELLDVAAVVSLDLARLLDELHSLP